MKLALASAAAPDAPLGDLLAACRRRGFAALELEEGHKHGVARELGALEAFAATELVTTTGFELVGLRLHGPIREGAVRLLRLQEALAAPLIIDASRPEAPDVAALLAREGPRRVMLSTRDPLELLESLPPSVGLAWDVAPAEGSGEDEASAHRTVVERTGRRLRHVRLLGGGPESALHEGRGIGTLMGTLALSGFPGTLAVAPSSTRYRVAWDAWLGRRGGWGCGGAHEAPELVHIGGGGSIEAARDGSVP